MTDEQTPPEVIEPAAQPEPVTEETVVVTPAALPQEEVAPVVPASSDISTETTVVPVPISESTAPVVEPTPEVPAPTPPPDIAAPLPRYSPEDRAKARAAKQEKKEAMLAAILTLSLELHEQSLPITNDAVQHITELSDTTVAVYLRELVSRGYLVKHGKGRWVRYVLIV